MSKKLYKLLWDNIYNRESYMILRLSDNACIPADANNTDYQAYLKWLEEGNEPEAAD